MAPHLDRDQWSGEGDFTQTLVDWLLECDMITFVRVEDSESARTDVDYNLLSNEIFVEFRTRERVERELLWGIIPRKRVVTEKLMTLDHLDVALGEDMNIGTPDYADEGMIQFLKTDRVIPPYQTKGYKLIELVRIYEVGMSRQT